MARQRKDDEVVIFKQKGRNFWMMRRNDPTTGKRIAKSTGCSDEKKARLIAESVFSAAIHAAETHASEAAKIELRESVLGILDSVFGIASPSRIALKGIPAAYCDLPEVKHKTTKNRGPQSILIIQYESEAVT